MHRQNTTYLNGWIWSLVLVLSSATAFAEPLFLEAELRPYAFSSGTAWGMQNYVELGIAPTKKLRLSYQQQFAMDLDHSPLAHSPFGLFDGYFRLKANQIWTDSEYGLDLHYQSRVYLPTEGSKADRGMIATWRNYFIFERHITPTTAFVFMVVPILHVYDRDGSGTGDKMAANPIFENRLVVGPYFTWGNVELSAYLYFQSTRFRSFHPKAKYNDGWTHALWINPELTISLSSIFKIGAGFESGTFSDAAFTTISDSDPFHAGNLQFFLRATF